VGPPASVVYADTRFAWQTVEGDVVRLHWYDGSAAFGRRALAIGEEAVRAAAAFLGVTESAPIDFFVYADKDAFYDAVGPGTRENVGGTAFPGIRTMFARIGPAEVSDAWVATVIPHELTHLVFASAVDNPYHAPPYWLNEGVAVYLTEGYSPADRGTTEAAAADGRLMPLVALDGYFPNSADRFYLAYAQSTSAVDFLVREKGIDALVRLIRSYADGVSDDEAFEAAAGWDLAGFQAAWLDDLGAAPPVRHGPQPAPAGPLPPGWDAAAATAGPDVTERPGAGTQLPAAATPPPGAASGDGGSPWREGLVLALVAACGLVVGGSLALARRRRQPPTDAHAAMSETGVVVSETGADGPPGEDLR
jgi:hypothetical protein